MNRLTLIEWRTKKLKSPTSSVLVSSIEYSLVDGVLPREKLAERIKKVVEAKLKQDCWKVSVTVDKTENYFSKEDFLADLYGVVLLPKIVVQITQLRY